VRQERQGLVDDFTIMERGGSWLEATGSCGCWWESVPVNRDLAISFNRYSTIVASVTVDKSSST
jgi:hypothetical protein